jgi:hypothetical protein
VARCRSLADQLVPTDKSALTFFRVYYFSPSVLPNLESIECHQPSDKRRHRPTWNYLKWNYLYHHEFHNCSHFSVPLLSAGNQTSHFDKFLLDRCRTSRPWANIYSAQTHLKISYSRRAHKYFPFLVLTTRATFYRCRRSPDRTEYIFLAFL